MYYKIFRLKIVECSPIFLKFVKQSFKRVDYESKIWVNTAGIDCIYGL